MQNAVAAQRISDPVVISTYDTDYLMVNESALEKAIRVLETAGHKVRRL